MPCPVLPAATMSFSRFAARYALFVAADILYTRRHAAAVRLPASLLPPAARRQPSTFDYFRLL